MRVKMKKILLIDWYNTLCNSEYFHFESKETNDLIVKRLFQDHRSLVVDWLKGIVTEDDIIKQISDQNITPPLIKKAINQGCDLVDFYDPCVIDKINILKNNGYKVVLATNIMDTFTLKVVPRLGLKSIFDEILTSNEIGVLKTDVDSNGELLFFEPFLKKQKLSFNNLIIVDDDINLIKLLQKKKCEVHHINEISQTKDILNNLIGKL